MGSSNGHLPIYHRDKHSTSWTHTHVQPTRAKPPANIFLSIFLLSYLTKFFIASLREYKSAPVTLWAHLSPVVHEAYSLIKTVVPFFRKFL